MATRPSFVVEDQSEVIAFLEQRLAPAKRIDTHGAVVFLSGERAYKLKRAVKFPYMDFSTLERRAAMCTAEVETNRRLAPEKVPVEERREHPPAAAATQLSVLGTFAARFPAVAELRDPLTRG